MPQATTSAPALIPHAEFSASMATLMVGFRKSTESAVAAEREEEILRAHRTPQETFKLINAVALPKKLEPLRVPANRPKEIEDVVSGLKQHLSSMQAGYHARLTALQANAKKETKDSFRAKMEALRAQSKADSDRAVDQAYAQLTKIGVAHPESRSLIAEAAKSVAQLEVLVVTTIATAINTALNLGEKAIEAVENAVKEAAETVGHAFESAGKAVASIFSGW